MTAPLKRYSAREFGDLMARLAEDVDAQLLLPIIESGRLSKSQRETVRQVLAVMQAPRHKGRKRDEVWTLAIEAMRLRLKGMPLMDAACAVTACGDTQMRVARRMHNNKAELQRLAKAKSTPKIDPPIPGVDSARGDLATR